LYCKVIAPDSTRDSLRVRIGPSDSASAAWGTSATFNFRGTATTRTDGSFTVDLFPFDDAGNPYCGSAHLDGTDANGSVSGTWSETIDCHGARRWGHFTGHR
jgi:hypothetical protein